jgi:hypothetical protein
MRGAVDMMETVRRVSAMAKCRDGVAHGMMEAAKGFGRLKAYKHLPILSDMDARKLRDDAVTYVKNNPLWPSS